MSYTRFNPKNLTVGACVLAMRLTAQGEVKKAHKVVEEAFQKANNPLEKFITAYQLAEQTQNSLMKKEWLEKALFYVEKSEDQNSKTALKAIYAQLADVYKQLDDDELARYNQERAANQSSIPDDPGPFYHGTRASLTSGDLLVAGKNSNYEADLKMNHIYFTSNLEGASLAASLAKGEGEERIYIVEPTGIFEHDPNVTDKKFPGNLTCSYRSTFPLKVIGEVTAYAKQSEADRKQWQSNMAKHQGEIIN